MNFLFLISAPDANENGEDTLERLRNITKMFATKSNDEESEQPLKKIERIAPSDKIRNTFQKWVESNDLIDRSLVYLWFEGKNEKEWESVKQKERNETERERERKWKKKKQKYEWN